MGDEICVLDSSSSNSLTGGVVAGSSQNQYQESLLRVEVVNLLLWLFLELTWIWSGWFFYGNYSALSTALACTVIKVYDHDHDDDYNDDADNDDNDNNNDDGVPFLAMYNQNNILRICSFYFCY